jgi:phosphoribosylamine--glycine ligase
VDILVLGSGGREHAIIWKLKQSKKVEKIFCAPGNGGISDLAECIDISVTEFEKIAEFAVKNSVDMVVVGPDDPLALGIVDYLEAYFKNNGKENIKVFGPNKSAARFEASKSFSKEFMQRHNIPTADYQVFDNADKANAYLKTAKYPIVIKADGLALGKGVSIVENYEEAYKVIDSIMNDKIFGESGDTVVIEEFMVGPEVSVLAFVDGKTIKPMLPAQDHKSIYEGNKGPNTGGMGTICPPKEYTDEIHKISMDTIFNRTVEGFIKDNIEFKGVLFFGIMLTNEGPKLLEYNVRFGDPETQSVLLRLENDIVDIFEACVDGALDKLELNWKAGASCCVIIASGGYPAKYAKGYEITGIHEAEKNSDIVVFHAGTSKKDSNYYTNGGRVLGVSAIGKNADEALDKAYEAVKKIEFKDMYLRKDIGRVWEK